MTAAFGLALGTQVGAYVIDGELGEGGMGVVYRARHIHLGRPAAIKILRPEFVSNPLALDRFLNEARATTAIRHPGIVEVFDYGHADNGCAYIAMELLEGSSLGACLARRGPLPVLEALRLARRIAAPLAVAHEAGIVHRDLKPDNVFLVRDPDGGTVDHVKLLDFGIAKLATASNRTTVGVVLGTPAYMAPEQCLGAPDCDLRVDLYALGCILFELLTGEPPFGRSGAMTSIMAAHLNAPVPRLPLAPMDHAVGRLVHRLLAKAPDARPRTATEVTWELDRLLAVATPTAVPRGPMRAAIAAVTGVALALTSLGAWYRWRRAPRVDAAELGPAPAALGSEIRRPLARSLAELSRAEARATASTAPTVALDAAATRAITPLLKRHVQAVEILPQPSPPLPAHPPVLPASSRIDSEVTTELSSPPGHVDVNTTVSQ